MKSFLYSIKKTILIGACLLCLFSTNSGYAAEGLQKLRVAYAAITAAFSIPWIAKEAGIFQRPGLGVLVVYISARALANPTPVRRGPGRSGGCGAEYRPGSDRRTGGRRRQACRGRHGLYRHTGKSGACLFGGGAEYLACRGAAREEHRGYAGWNRKGVFFTNIFPSKTAYARPGCDGSV